jgi:adenylate kinase family enzyme
MGCTSSSSVDVANPTSSTRLPKVIFVTGAPGAGKRTQCAKVVEKYGFAHLNVLDCLKKEVASGSANGKVIEGLMAAGKLVDSDMVVDAIES